MTSETFYFVLTERYEKKGHRSTANNVRDVSKGSLYRRLDGSLSRRYTSLHGDGFITIHYLFVIVNRRRKGEQNQRRNENNGIERFGFLVIVVHHLRHLRLILIGRLLRAFIYVTRLSKYEFLVDIFTGRSLFIVDHHVWIHDNAILR